MDASSPVSPGLAADECLSLFSSPKLEPCYAFSSQHLSDKLALNSPTLFSALSVFGSAVKMRALDVAGASVLEPWRARAFSACFAISTILLQSDCMSLLLLLLLWVATKGAPASQWPVNVHTSSTSPMLTHLRAPLIAPGAGVGRANGVTDASLQTVCRGEPRQSKHFNSTAVDTARQLLSIFIQ